MTRTATPKQLACLKRAAAERGVSFAYPSTFAEADAEIKRLLARKGTGSTFAELDVQHRNAPAFDRTMTAAAPVLDTELTGYGASATWR